MPNKAVLVALLMSAAGCGAPDNGAYRRATTDVDNQKSHVVDPNADSVNDSYAEGINRRGPDTTIKYDYWERELVANGVTDPQVSHAIVFQHFARQYDTLVTKDARHDGTPEKALKSFHGWCDQKGFGDEFDQWWSKR